MLTSCNKPEKQVVVYTALDRNFSEPIFQKFTEQTGIRVLPKYDIESTKTVGLVNTIIAEATHPRCDVFWNNEIINTIRLKKLNLLQTANPTNAQFYSDTYKDPEHQWYGFAARARVIIANTNLLRDEEIPHSLEDLCAPALKGRVAIAKPLFGTTATHVASLFAYLNPDSAKNLFLRLKQNDIRIESGNKSCAVNVGNGQLAAALTDTDDAIEELRAGSPVKIIYVDAEPGQRGALFIPNTVALIQNCPHPDEGKLLIDYLLSEDVENMLAQGDSAQIPLNNRFNGSHPLQPFPENKMKIDFAQAAERFDSTAQWIDQVFLAP